MTTLKSQIALSVLSAGTFLATNAYSYDSIIETTSGTEKDYSYIVKQIVDGKTETSYYKFNVIFDAFSNSESIKWYLGASADNDENDLTIFLPENIQETYNYTFTSTYSPTQPGNINLSGGDNVFRDEKKSGGAYLKNSETTEIKDVLISGNKVTANHYRIGDGLGKLSVEGGAIYNSGTINGIFADFTDNVMELSNASENENSSIAEIYGAAIHNTGTIDAQGINGNFINNAVTATAEDPVKGDNVKNIAQGGAISNSGIITTINGDFVNNNVTSTATDYALGNAYGGAISNFGYSFGEEASIEKITGNFIGNTVLSSARSHGGAISNDDQTLGTSSAYIGEISGNFINNKAIIQDTSDSSVDGAAGGAISNSKEIGIISGIFLNNSAETTRRSSGGGAIYSIKTISELNADFINNHTIGGSGTGGAIESATGTIGTINGNFIGNYNDSDLYGKGGAIYNGATISSVNSLFSGNYSKGKNGGQGGAIYNYGTMTINGDFVDNYVYSETGNVLGGAVYNTGNLNLHSNFIGNYAASDSGSAYGGAIFASKLNLLSGDKTYWLTDNYTSNTSEGKTYSAIFASEYFGQGAEITFDTTGGGAWIVNDDIKGGYYDTTNKTITYTNKQYGLIFTGDGTINEEGRTTQYVSINNDIVNAGEVSVENTTLHFGAYQHEDQTANNWDGKGNFKPAEGTKPVTSLSLTNAAFDLYNGYQDEVKLSGWSSNNGYLHIEVDVENLTADTLNITGNVEGQTNLLVYANSDKDIIGKSILFAQSTNDTTGNKDSFKVWRVYKSPYLFETSYTDDGSNNKSWNLVMTDEENPDADKKPEIPDNPDVPDIDVPDVEVPDVEVPDTDKPNIKPQPLPGSAIEVAPEVVGSQSLPSAALAQNSNLIYNIMNKVSANRLYCSGCGFYDYYWNGDAFHNVWVNPVYTSLNIDAPTKIEADIWGIEAGGDLQYDVNNRLGLFVSYRNGDYDMNGDGKHYYSTIGSEIEIDSYLAGLYYRYDKNNWYVFATVYGGMQEADLKTKDGVKSDTDGIEFGGSMEVGYDYVLSKTVYMTPSLGVFYSQVNYDNAKDNAGKEVKYNDLSQVELEAGIKLTKSFWYDEGFANIYIKPSIVQTLIDGDEITISGLGKVDTIDDDTLGRIELGGRYGFSQSLSTYGWANYTFGSDYDATSFGIGLNYAF